MPIQSTPLRIGLGAATLNELRTVRALDQHHFRTAAGRVGVGWSECRFSKQICSGHKAARESWTDRTRRARPLRAKPAERKTDGNRDANGNHYSHGTDPQSSTRDVELTNR